MAVIEIAFSTNFRLFDVICETATENDDILFPIKFASHEFKVGWIG